jgi:hypothetical protein
MYFLLVFVVITLCKRGISQASIYSKSTSVLTVTEVYYLNVALALFNTGELHHSPPLVSRLILYAFLSSYG